MKKEIIDKNSSPGVGEYDVGLKLGKVINIRNPQYKVVKLNDFKPKKIETSQKQTNEDYLVKSSFEGKRSFCSIFKSLSPKIVDSVKTDIPGPAYYRDDNIKKINYNFACILDFQREKKTFLLNIAKFRIKKCEN